jgi:hypothetical protein
MLAIRIHTIEELEKLHGVLSVFPFLASQQKGKRNINLCALCVSAVNKKL